MVFLISFLLILGSPAFPPQASYTEERGVSSQVKIFDFESSLVGLAHKEVQDVLVKKEWVKISKEEKKEVLTALSKPFQMRSLEILPRSLKKPKTSLPELSLLKVSKNINKTSKKLKVFLAPSKPVVKKNIAILSKSKKAKTQKEIVEDEKFILSGVLSWPKGFSEEDHLISLRREFQGQVYEEAILSSHHLIYDLELKDSFGNLVAEVFNFQGDVVARAERSLKQNTPLEFKPVKASEGFILSGRSQDMNISSWPFSYEAMKLSSSQKFSFSNFNRGSSFFLSFHDKSNIWSHLSFLRAGERKYFQFLSDSFVKALLGELLEKGYKTEDISLVWGKVKVKGVPQKGVKVEMAGSDVPPFYFTGFLPDSQRKETSENGLFVFITDREGVCPVRALKDDHVIAVDTLFCQKQVISLAQLEQREPLFIGISAFDPFQEKNLEAQVDILGEELQVKTSVDEESFISLPLGDGERLITAKAPGYEDTHINISQKSFKVEIPLISKKWIQYVMSEKKLLRHSQEGILVGFLENHEYEIFLDGTSYKGDVIYFNKQGHLVSEESPYKSGFLIKGLSHGLHNISLFFKDSSGRVFNKAILVDPSGINIVSYFPAPDKRSFPEEKELQKKKAIPSRKSKALNK